MSLVGVGNEPIQNSKKVDGPLLLIRGLTPRVVLTALIMILLLAIHDPRATLYGLSSRIDMDSVPTVPGIALLLFCVTILNPILARIRGVKVLSRFELTTLYTMVFVGGIVVGSVGRWVPFGIMGLGFRATLMEWEPSIPWFQRASRLFMVKDTQAIEDFWFGEAQVHWGAWIFPLISWTLFVLSIVILQLSVSSLVRERWEEEERLRYPIAQAVLKLTEVSQNNSRPLLFGNRFFWIGFLVAMIPLALNGLNRYIPVVPKISLSLNLAQYIGGDLRHIYVGRMPLKMSYNPMIMGVGYMIEGQLAFSIWFFFWFFVTLYTIWYRMGYWHSLYVEEIRNANQFMGALFGITLYLIWMCRKSIINTFKIGLLGMGQNTKSSNGDENELMSCKVSVWSTILSFGFILLFSIVFLEAAWWYAIVYWSIGIVMMLGVGRIRCQVGVPIRSVLEDWFYLIAQPVGTPLMKQISMGSVWFSDWPWALTQSGQSIGGIAAATLEQCKITGELRGRRREITVAIMIAAVAGTVLSLIFALSNIYRIGGMSADGVSQQYPSLYFRAIDNEYESYFPGPDMISLFRIVIIGFAGALWLMYMTSRFYWWPFHPIGFALATGVGHGAELWFPMFVAYVAKTLIFRWFGKTVYDSTLPVAYGLILGHVATNILMAIISVMVV